MSENCLKLSEVDGNNRSIEGEVVLAINVKGKKMGFSILDCSNKVLRVLNQDYTLSFATNYHSESILDSGAGNYLDEIISIVESLFLQNRPSVCVVSSRINPVCKEKIADKCKTIRCRVELLGNDLFNNINEFNSIELITSEDGGYLLNLLRKGEESISITRTTVSAIISYFLEYCQDEDHLDASRSSMRTTQSQAQNIIHFIEAINLGDRMLLDSETIASLNIFPETKYGQDKMIESGNFSIFEHFNKTSSALAKHILTNWLLFPLTNISQIKARSDTVGLFVHPGNSNLFDDLCSKIQKCPNMYSILNNLKTGNTSFKNWLQLYSFLEEGCDIYYILSSFPPEGISSESIITEIVEKFNIKAIRDIKQRVESIIDIGETEGCRKVRLLEGLDENLDEYRRNFNDIETILADTAYKEEQNIKRYRIEKCHNSDDLTKRFLNIIYIPQIGYLASITRSFTNRKLLEETLNWSLSFETSTTAYFVTPFTIELNDLYGDIYSFILDIEVEILQDLQEYILQFEGELYYLYRKIGELDVLRSFATVAQSYSYIEPTLKETDCSIHITNGRHPLYETITKTYIPNSLSLRGSSFTDNNWQTDNKKRVALVTGANGSGKTVFLTQIGLIVYLSQIGSYVPADNAIVGITDRILTRIHSKESLLVNRSTFENDMMQMSNCICLSTERSLLLVDEFGKGTDSIDGPALFGSIIKYFSENKRCPRVVACTHFSELFQRNILSTNIEGVQFLQTEVYITPKQQEDFSNIYCTENDRSSNVFLYNIIPGLSTDSLGLLCAKICGMKEEIVKRAVEFSKIMTEGGDIVDYCSIFSKSETEVFQKNQEIIKEFLQWDLDLETTTSQDILAQKLNSILSGYKIQKEFLLDL
ncbi:MutS protein msh5 [Maudiozyma exigua]|uniref:MutS protein msh5 n=1 Tax=Maudiozyma exigua TaxID=34358 RepID=A0A9P6WEB0_MAUEX|nr:MutS protein msh5 [Kazachstania exigua]